jgi:hypothetical protein
MLQKLGFLPGFNKQVTSTGAKSQWTGGTNVRFRYGTPEKIGGWSQLGDSKLTGAARGLHHMVNKTGIKYSLIGTNRILYAYTGDVYYDIHPLTNPSGTAITNAFSTTNGQPTELLLLHQHTILKLMILFCLEILLHLVLLQVQILVHQIFVIKNL